MSASRFRLSRYCSPPAALSSTCAEILLDQTSRSDADAALTEERSTHPRQSRQTPFCAISDNAKGPAQPLLHSQRRSQSLNRRRFPYRVMGAADALLAIAVGRRRPVATRVRLNAR